MIVSSWTRKNGTKEEHAEVVRNLGHFVAWNFDRGTYAAYRDDGRVEFESPEEAEWALEDDGWKRT